MAEKTNIEVIIDGRVYTLSGYESQEYLQKVASYLNTKKTEMNSISEYKRIPPDLKDILFQINLADDYFKAKSQIELLGEKLDQKEQEIYDLKHELVELQMKDEAVENESEE